VKQQKKKKKREFGGNEILCQLKPSGRSWFLKASLATALVVGISFGILPEIIKV
jgi:hypothetical protein